VQSDQIIFEFGKIELGFVECSVSHSMNRRDRRGQTYLVGEVLEGGDMGHEWP